MSPIRSVFRPISANAANFDYRDSAEWLGWKCIHCEDYAYYGVHLQLQIFGFENCVYKDANSICGLDVGIVSSVFTFTVYILI